MPIDSVRENLDELDPAIAELYKKGEGDYKDKYILDVKAVSGLQLTNATRLKSALDKERDAHKDLESKLKVFEGIDPNAARDALNKVKEMDDWDPEEKLSQHKQKFESQVKEQFDLQTNQLKEKLNTEVKSRDGKINTLTKQLERSMIEEHSTKVISKLGGNAKLLLPHFKEHLRMKELDNGEYDVVVVNRKGEERLSPTPGKDGNMSIEELGLEMRQSDDFGEAFKGSPASGSGSGAPNRGQGTTGGKVHRISEADATDTIKYKAAKAAAEKAGVTLEIY